MQDKNDLQKRRPIIVIALITAACLVGDSMLYMVLPTHWQEAGLNSLWEVGILLAINRLVRLPLNPVVGWIYQRISNRSGILLAVGMAALTTIAYGYVHSFLWWLIVRCVWGIAWTFLRLGAYFVILEIAGDSDRGYFMGTYNGLYRLGSLVGMLVGGFFADCYGMGLTALLFGSITCLTIPFVFLYVPKSTAIKRDIQIQNAGQKVRWQNSAVIWGMVTGSIVAMIYQGVVAATLSHLIQIHTGDEILLWGMAMGSASLAGILQALRWSWEPWLAPWFGKFSDGKWGRQPLLVGSLFMASIFFSLLSLPIPLVLWLLILLGIQLTGTVLTTLADAVVSDMAACTAKVAVMSWYSFAIDFGAALGPILAYLLDEVWAGYAACWVVAGVLLLLAAKWLIAPPVAKRAHVIM
jgi:MFS family permease